MNNETLKTSNERRLSGEEAKSYLSILYLLCIHREQWACLALCFHATASSARGCSSWDERTTPIGIDVSEYIRTMTCITASYFSMPFDSLVHTYKQGNGNNNQKKKQVKTFLVLAQFFLNQSAGNKAGFCSLLKGAEQQMQPARKQSPSPGILWQCKCTHVTFILRYWKAVDQAAKALFSTSACSERISSVSSA